MNLRPKTKRRVAVLLLGAVVILGSATTAVVVRLHRLRAGRELHRLVAFAAFDRGDFPQAATEFDRTLAGSDDTDAPALLADGIAHLHLAATDDHQAITARLMLSRYLQSQPGDGDAEHALLQADRQLGFETDVLMLSRALLAQNAADVPALVAQVHTLSASGQYAAAEQASEALNAAQPSDVVAQAATLRLLRLGGAPSAQIVGRADSLLTAHPADADFLLLRGLAAADIDQAADALTWFGRASAAAPPLDTPGLLLLSDALDHLGRFPQATTLLAHAAADHPADADLRAVWLLREWEHGHPAAVLQQLGDIGPADTHADARLLGIKALAGDPSAATCVATLQSRPTDRLAGAWANILQARSTTPPLPPVTAMQLCRTALARDEQNAVAVEALGRIEASVGERDLALQAWQDAAQLAPAWAEPHAQRADAFRVAGSFDRARAEVQLALARDPASSLLQELATQLDQGHAPPARQITPDDTRRQATAAAAAPLDAAAQHAVLDNPLAWADRALIRATINRLRRITGDDGLEWRMAQAQWLLSASDAAPTNADAAATLMAEVARLAPESPRPLLIWADALQRLGDRPNALARLKAAAAIAPGDPAVASRLRAL